MSRYTSATDADRRAMLDGGRRRLRRGALRRRPGRTAPRPRRSSSRTGCPRTRSTAACARSPPATRTPSPSSASSAAACTTTTRRRSSTRSRRARSSSPLHAVPARDLAGRPADDVRVPDRDVRADRRCRSPRAGLYEGPSTVAAAGYLALGAAKGKRRRFVVSRGLHPHSRETLADLLARLRGRGRRGRARRAALTDPGALAELLDDETAALFVQNPNYLGSVEDLEALAEAAHARRRPADRRLRRDLRSASCARPASAAPTSPSARASRSAAASTTAAPRSASSARPRSTCAACPAGSRVRRPTSTAAAASSSRCRPASSTSAARRRPTTSAPRRR